MSERTEESLKARVRETPLIERLNESRKRIAAMCSERRGPKMTIPVEYYDDDFFICATLEDARDEVARLAKLKEAFTKTTKGRITMSRYEHGGGRMFVDDGKNRDLIADTYNEGDREFIALCYEVFAALAPQGGKGGGK